MVFGRGGKTKPKNKWLAKGDNKADRKRKREASSALYEEIVVLANVKADALAQPEANHCVAVADAHDIARVHTAAETEKPSAKKRVKMTMREVEDSGRVVVSQEDKRNYIKVAYAIRYDEPDVSDWGQIAGVLMGETCMRCDTILEIFNKCHSGVPHPEQHDGRRSQLLQR